MDNDLMARRLRPPSQPMTPQPTALAPSAPAAINPTPWAALPDGMSDDAPLMHSAEADAASDTQARDEATPGAEQTLPFEQPATYAHPAPLDQPGPFHPGLRADVPWDKPDPEPWPPSIDDELHAAADSWGLTLDPWAPTVDEPVAVADDWGTPAEPWAPTADTTRPDVDPWGPTPDLASLSDSGFESVSEAVAYESAEDSTWAVPELVAPEPVAAGADDAPWETQAETVAEADLGTAEEPQAEPEAWQLNWSNPETAEVVAEATAVDAVAEPVSDDEATTVEPEMHAAPEPLWDANPEPAQIAWDAAATTALQDDSVESSSGQWHAGAESTVAEADGQPFALDGLGETVFEDRAEPTTLEATEEVAAAEQQVEEPSEAAADFASVDNDETDSFVAGRPAWDAPDQFDLEDSDEMYDDRPADMLADYDDMFAVVTSAVAAASPSVTPPEVEASTNDDTLDPDDAMAPVLEDVERPHVPNWTLWQAPVDVGASAEAADTEAADTQTTKPEPDVTRVSAQIAGATIAADVGQTVVRQLPALYSTAPAGLQQPLVVRIELTIRDEGNRIGAAEMAKPVNSWTEVPLAQDEFENDLDEDESDDAWPPTPPPSQSKAAASSWSIPALDDESANDSPHQFAAQPRRVDPLADVPAAKSVVGEETRHELNTTHPGTTAPPAWFDSAPPARPESTGSSDAQPAPGVTPEDQAATSNDGGTWYMVPPADGATAAEANEPKAKQSRLMMGGATVAMAFVVVLLVVVFVSQMTSLLR